MELSKHKNHRNVAYLGWLRKQKCIITGQKAQCAHHIRLGTNGGSSLKPSDYFCIPLLNKFHSTGLFAIHVIGEYTFFKQLELNKNELIIGYLRQYIIEKFNTHVELSNSNENELIAYMINLIEKSVPKSDRPCKKSNSNKSITENDFFQKAKEEKKIRDRQLRIKMKAEDKTLAKKATVSTTQSEYYQKAKELKREIDKELRAKLKLSQKTKKTSITQSEYYQQAKELKRKRDKELRQKIKEQRKNTSPPPCS